MGDSRLLSRDLEGTFNKDPLPPPFVPLLCALQSCCGDLSQEGLVAVPIIASLALDLCDRSPLWLTQLQVCMGHMGWGPTFDLS